MPKEIKKEKVLTISIKESEDGGREIILNGDESLLPAISRKIDALIRNQYKECERSLYCMPSYTLPLPPDLAFSMPTREQIRKYKVFGDKEEIEEALNKLQKVKAKSEKIFSEEKEKEEEKPVLSYLW